MDNWEKWVVGVLLLVFAEYGVYHMGELAQAKVDQVKIDSVKADKEAALDANKSQKAAQDALQSSLAECTARIASNQVAADSAVATQKLNTETAQKAFAVANTQLTTLLAGECKAWAALPACTVDLPLTPKKGK